ncbi:MULTISPECIES: 1-deoxy-D-xylulose-5-phosphate reductoisomerase [Pseudobutyrivibrio]|uniref:1-deoxy-D-xylulose 5-phosphate reductoisomerase n=2 Tax=Pseudobutyrivibrio TaxID=46205 RepID=A0A2G3E9P8_9FIRM|nr:MULTISPECIES: 1-deoxy-D-xylulose-5-phosphate reductoisomerase [Pseudobutyrivibrio]NEX01021.1 1-deoxy-D-xylulose-5-phosphate reductoisomerase [Pseudobutyrivibrio xylanivorans]PHU34913.1 1-deoxy-D-xylulose-5-phosphate reductoisomerase [Pseudobutyrivibrio ruminis]PHU40029.1 1-deoxy-D-xylulose-5-phosphate reductoisomerase [Pseudobutyrivibrio ruminis]SFR64468.1 1-deoxy-D-xylulose 5-phosphate reductoisomerase [Pseudobutyrivibrio sp. NOR37]
MAQKIAILGSTGSIGTQTLDIVSQNPDDLQVVAMSCGSNIDLFEKQIRKYRPSLVSVGNEKLANDLKTRLSDIDIDIRYGMDGLIAVATAEDADTVVTAVVGMIGVQPTIAAINAKKTIALANKETLVTAGHIIMPLAKEKGVSILPVDSEHSAIFQSLNGERHNQISKILLTASGGPFRGKTLDDLENVTLEDALKHPNWSMGAKITIDSATMINKGLEVMEAKWLFGVNLNQVEVVVHPQSILHSAVEFMDGAVIGQMGTPDMRLPILYALFYPNRKTLYAEPLDLFKVGTLTFEKPDMETFYGLSLAYDAMDAGGNVPTVFNAANEKAVAKFLNNKIKFLEIPEIVSEAMINVDFIPNPTIEQVLETEQMTYDFIEGRW